MAPLQKRAWYGLAIGACFCCCPRVVFILKGGIRPLMKTRVQDNY